MLKPNANFKLSKSVKRMMAAHADSQYSNLIKRNFIQAELAAAQQYKPSKGKRDSQEG